LFIDHEGSPRELYDLSVDPLEFFDVSDKKRDVVADLMSRFETQEYLLGGTGHK
jgi:hypothetical protein